MKKIVLTLLLISFLLLPVVGSAAIIPAPEIGFLIGLDRIENIIFTILVAAAVIFVMIGAFQLLSAGGDTEKIGEGRQKILYAVIAVVVALLARGIIDFIRRAFPGT